MSTEKSVDVVGCDASIMRNAWEIREKEYEMKMQYELERTEKSALKTINKDWENRMGVRLGKGKRVARKLKAPESQLDSIWKDKQPPPTLPHGAGSNVVGKPGGQMRGLSSSSLKEKDKMGQDKYVNRLKLLMFISQTQPSAMVWGKSWKQNKPLPSPEEGAAAPPDWGKCWMFATHQPYTEPGKPWLNGPNLMDPQGLHVWNKPEYRLLESQELDLILPTLEWQMSWRKSDKNNEGNTSSENNESVHNSGLLTLLMETQHYNETLWSSDWSDSWKSTKPGSQKDNFTIPASSSAKKQDEVGNRNSTWEECWKLVNHLGCKEIKSPINEQILGSQWEHSWRAATNGHSDTRDDHGQQKESHLHKIILLSHEQKHRDQYLHHLNEFISFSEWSKAWQVTKNNSKPSEEIEKLLKMEKMAKRHDSLLEANKPSDEQMKYDVIYSKREFNKISLLHNKHLTKVLLPSEWRNSWKTLKHRMRMERRLRSDAFQPFRESDKGGDLKPTPTVWKNSWKFTCQPLHQEPEQWQQRWLTTPQNRAERVRGQNHFAPVELPKNGPTGDRSWGESWRLQRIQRRSQPMQDRMQTNLERSNMARHGLDGSISHRSNRYSGYSQSVSDWQEAWMVSETQFHHDRPSLTQWREAWKCSFFNIEQWSHQLCGESVFGALMEIQSQREITLQRAKYKLSRTFDEQVFRKRYPEKEWDASWRGGSLFNHQQSNYRSPGKSWKSGTAQQEHVSDNGHGSPWGMSFRIANPMPQVNKPWVECSPNLSPYRVMQSRGKKIQNSVIDNFRITPSIFMLWKKSHRFLQEANAKIIDKTKTKKPVDPRVIIRKTLKIRLYLYSKIEQEKKSDRKWSGCHLLGKTQPRPKKGLASGQKFRMEDENQEFFTKWAESWRFQHNSLKKQMSIKSLAGWEESWKFLLPMCQPMNGPKSK